jgi:hypothetical protein
MNCCTAQYNWTLSTTYNTGNVVNVMSCCTPQDEWANATSYVTGYVVSVGATDPSSSSSSASPSPSSSPSASPSASPSPSPSASPIPPQPSASSCCLSTGDWTKGQYYTPNSVVSHMVYVNTGGTP